MAATTAMATYHVELDITALEQLIQTQAALAADITLNAESMIALAQRIEALEEVRRISAFAGDVLARIEGLETLMRRHDIRITKAEERLENAESLTVNAMGAWGKAAPRLHAQGVRIEALESAQAELAEDVSNHGGRLQSVETRVEQVAGDAQATGWRQMMATRLMALEEAAQPHEVPLSPDPLPTSLTHRRDAIDGVIRDLELRIGALQWQQPRSASEDERKGFREGAGWALGVVRSARPCILNQVGSQRP